MDKVAVLLGTPVVDVLVIMLLKFQQSLPTDSETVPQIQFIDRLLNFQLCHRGVYAQCKLCRKPEIPQCSSWFRLFDVPVVVQRPVPGMVQTLLKTSGGSRRSCELQRQVPAVHVCKLC